MSNSNLVRYSRSQALQHSSPNLEMSEAFTKNMAMLRESGDRFKQLDNLIRASIDPKQPQFKYKLARIFEALIPQRLLHLMPEGMTRLLAENIEILEKIDTLFRLNLNTIQQAAVENIKEARVKKADLDKLIRDIKTAEKEEWNVQTLQKFVAARNGIAIHQEILNVFQEELGLISKEDHEALRQEILSTLKSDETNVEELIKLLKTACSACVRLFSQGNLEYNSYRNLHRPAAVLRDATRDMLSLNNSMFIGREAFLRTVELSAEVIDDIVNTFDEAAKLRLASVDTKLRLQAARSRIEGKVAQLRTTIDAQNDDMILEGEVEEVTPLQLEANK